MSKNDFISQIEEDIKKAEAAAEVHIDTQVVNLKPVFDNGITQESLNKHVDFINRQGAIVHAVTSNVGYSNFEKVGAKEWTGTMDLGDVQITAHTNVRDDVDQDNVIYGVGDMFFDFKHSEDLSSWYDSFIEADHNRCSALFEEK